MKGDIYDMSERSRHAILKWYLIYRKNPAAIGASLHLLCAVVSVFIDNSCLLTDYIIDWIKVGTIPHTHRFDGSYSLYIHIRAAEIND